mmetsp:Transcript_4810/g.7280  ORF Transcript_4810/g.7280 Transcript_4810/m.7280 type:complete len:232 (+) Transcript_4810:1024-1719(+)
MNGSRVKHPIQIFVDGIEEKGEVLLHVMLAVILEMIHCQVDGGFESLGGNYWYFPFHAAPHCFDHFAERFGYRSFESVNIFSVDFFFEVVAQKIIGKRPNVTQALQSCGHKASVAQVLKAHEAPVSPHVFGLDQNVNIVVGRAVLVHFPHPSIFTSSFLFESKRTLLRQNLLRGVQPPQHLGALIIDAFFGPCVFSFGIGDRDSFLGADFNAIGCEFRSCATHEEFRRCGD